MIIPVDFKINNVEISFTVSEEIGALLISDDEYTLDYMRRAAYAGHLQVCGVTAHNIDNVSIERLTNDADKADEDPGSPSTSYENTAQEIWTNRSRNAQRDRDATFLLLDLRLEYGKSFNNKKENKKQLWGKIANKLNDAGYNLGLKNGGEKCRQKFANMQKLYIQFISNSKKTGASALEKPEFFDKLHAILGDKDKVKPPFVFDSLDLEDGSSTEIHTAQHSTVSIQSEEERPGPSNAPETEKVPNVDRFADVKKSAKPCKISNAEILSEIKELEEKKFNIFANFIESTRLQNERDSMLKERLIICLESLINKDKKQKKRKRTTSSDSE